MPAATRILMVLFLMFAANGLSAGLAEERQSAPSPDSSILAEIGLAPAPGPAPDLAQSPIRQIAQCCKICRKGKACGNSCIKRTYTCRQPPGCACDAN